MNRFYYLLTGMVIILVLIISCSDDESEGSEHIIDICHYDEVTGTWENLSIVENTLETHLDHGDGEGECSDVKVDVCHYNVETDTVETLSIVENALEPHLDRGDDPGACPPIASAACDGTEVGPTGLKIGDFHKGGVIFWLNESRCKGLVASLRNISWCLGKDTPYNEIPWSRMQKRAGEVVVRHRITNATATGINKGWNNTRKITNAIRKPDSPNDCNRTYAAWTIRDYESQGYTDWFLPSFGELGLIFKHQDLIAETSKEHGGHGFHREGYWSSTESSDLPRNEAYWIDFKGAASSTQLRKGGDKDIAFHIRAARKFTGT